ncbi:MAG: hypothetical protein VZR06_11000 [Butyrivibrio sp.]|uniref:hypothetical protein n=1 Tax=Butyrivibrio sp. LB2008 TaxID=1408305 RepID=UPI00047BEB5A|nr:hypothetical protein [Butyrivibrio sp. LB2008]MEE3495680.1 hypothetical protein [Butyrivibrio sp.]
MDVTVTTQNITESYDEAMDSYLCSEKYRQKVSAANSLFAAFRRELTLDQCDTLACLLNMYDAISREEAQEALRVGMLIGQDSLKK